MAGRVYGYQGYQFETSPRKLQPEYEPKKEKDKTQKKYMHTKIEQPKTQKGQNKKKIAKKNTKKKVKYFAYIVVGFAIVFTISYRNSIINEKFTENQSLKSQLEDIQKENEQLEVSVENDLNLSNVEKQAKEKIGMNKLNNDQKIYIKLPKKEYIQVNSNTQNHGKNENFFKKAYESVINYLK